MCDLAKPRKETHVNPKILMATKIIGQATKQKALLLFTSTRVNNNCLGTYVVKGLMPSNSARYTKSVELHYESGKMKMRRFLLNTV